MLISHRKKFIFTKTAKTAGTSTEVYFEPSCLPEGTWQFMHARETFVGATGIIGYRGADATGQEWYNHMPAYLIRQKIGHSLWASYYKFCTIRNPYTKLVSAFHFLERTSTPASNNPSIKTFQYPRTMTLELKERFRTWLRHEGQIEDRDKYTINGELCLDYFIKQEDLENGIKHVCQTLGLKFEPENIPRLKSDDRPRNYQWRDYYDFDTIDIVAKRYEFEFAHFGYPIQP